MPPEFDARVITIIRRIPRGRVLGYRDVAALAGNALAARRVGALVKGSKGLPWWRVIGSDGRPRCGRDQERRLQAEGVGIVRGRVIMARHRWRPSARPKQGKPLRDGAREP